MEMRRITKCSFKEADNRVRIEYQTVNPNDHSKWDDHVLVCNDAPMPSFIQALKDCIQSAMDMCELPASYGDTCKCRGVTISFAGEQDTMGAVITVLKSLKSSNSPLCINTPHKPVTAYSEGGDESNCLPMNAAQAIEQVMNEAELYLDGERSQGVIKDGEDEIGTKENKRGSELPGMSVSISTGGKTVELSGKDFVRGANAITRNAKASIKKKAQ